MTIEELEDRLALLGFGNFSFQLRGPDEVEAMVELHDGSIIGWTGKTLTWATEGLLEKLEQLDGA